MASMTDETTTTHRGGDMHSRIADAIDAMTRTAVMAETAATDLDHTYGAECAESVAYWQGVAHGRREAAAVLRNVLGLTATPVRHA